MPTDTSTKTFVRSYARYAGLNYTFALREITSTPTALIGDWCWQPTTDGIQTLRLSGGAAYSAATVIATQFSRAGITGEHLSIGTHGTLTGSQWLAIVLNADPMLYVERSPVRGAQAQYINGRLTIDWMESVPHEVMNQLEAAMRSSRSIRPGRSY